MSVNEIIEKFMDNLKNFDLIKIILSVYSKKGIKRIY